MEISLHADLSFRVLMYLAITPNLVKIRQISDAYGVSNNHLIKVVHKLSLAGFVQTVLGRNGGIRLAMKPKQINLGEVLRKMEPGFRLFECFDEKTNTCPIAPVCELIAVADAAMAAFLKTFDQYTLADITKIPKPLRSILGIKASRS